MHPWFVGFATGLRRSLARHQDRPPSAARREPLWRLLVDEAIYVARRAVQPAVLRVWLPAVAVAAIVMVAFAETTPGPVLSFGIRAGVAVTAGLLVAVAARRWSYRKDG